MTATMNNREKILAIITFCVVIGAIVFTVIIEPQLEKRKQCLKHMRQSQLKLTKMKADLLIKDRIDTIYTQIEPFIAGDGTEQQEKAQFTRELSRLCSKLNTTSTTILPTTNEDYYRRLSAKIEMNGHIRDILGFILAVEAYSNPIRIEQFDFKAREIADNIHATFIITKVVAGTREKVN